MIIKKMHGIVNNIIDANDHDIVISPILCDLLWKQYEVKEISVWMFNSK